MIIDDSPRTSIRIFNMERGQTGGRGAAAGWGVVRGVNVLGLIVP